MQRRDLLTGLLSLGALGLSKAQAETGGFAVFNTESFRAHIWQDYFHSTQNGAILVDVASRSLHFWSADQRVFRVYPCSVPLSADLTRRGKTSVVEKVAAPVWRPTPAMRQRHPDWPAAVAPGPNNPLGPFALYLGWQYFRIHGTHDPAKIGRQASSGCFGLYNQDIAELFGLVQVGAQVVVI